MNTIGVALIGCGGRIKFVSRRLFRISGNLKIVGGYDVVKEHVASTRAFLKNTGEYPHDVNDIKEYQSLEECVNDPEVQWVMIGSWNSKHGEHAVAALNAGKHVFCEKPLATTIEDCLAIRDAWKKSGKSFAMGFVLRYSAYYRKIKELLDSNAIGDIVSMEFNETLDFNHGALIHAGWRRFTDNAGTHLLEKCCHDVDLVNWLVGSRVKRAASFSGLNFFIPENVHHIDRIGENKNGSKAYCLHGNKAPGPFISDKDISDNQVIIMEYENQVRATFHLNCHAAIPERRMYILGTEGALRFNIQSGVIETKRIGWETPRVVYDLGVTDGHGGGDEIMAKELSEYMLEERVPVATFKHGLESAVTCLGIDRADSTGQVFDLTPLWERVDS